MRSIHWLLVAGLIGATTAACTEQYGYPSTAYNSGYYNSGYSSNGYDNNAYYNNRPSSTGYVYATTPSRPYYSSAGYGYTPRRYGPNGDYDRDGIPNKHDRDANGDGIPDRYQR